MFQIPKWEEDVPKSNVDFGKAKVVKSIKQKSTKPSIIPESPSIVNNQNSNQKNNKKGKKKFKNKQKDSVNLRINNLPQIIKESFPQTIPSGKKKLKKLKNKKIEETNGIKPQSGEVLEKETTEVNSRKKRKPRKRKQNEESSRELEVDGGNDVSSQESSKPKRKKNNLETNITPHTEKQQNNKETFKTRDEKKKEKFRMILQMESKRNPINVSGNNLRQRMLERLKAAQFRFLNEKLYTSSGSEAQKLFQSDPEAFSTYHQGYQQQLQKWPVNPLDLIVKRISKMPKTHTIADMGCGEAALSRRVPQTVRSFDLVATSPAVEACDMARTPLLAASVDVAVYCLALMGTDLTQYLMEANRVLKIGGHLLIAEVESRFDKVETFSEEVQRLGFKLKNLDKSHKVFFFLEFTKVRDPPAKKSKLPAITLRPCLYKKR